MGLRRETPLEINLGKTNIPLDDISDASCFGNIRISVRRTCQTRFRYDRATFYVGGFLPDPYIVFEVESEPEFEDFKDEIENDGIFWNRGKLERGNSCSALQRQRLVNTFKEKNSFSSKNLNKNKNIQLNSYNDIFGETDISCKARPYVYRN